MRKSLTLLSLLLALLCTHAAQAQRDTTDMLMNVPGKPKYLKVNVLPVIFNSYNLSYEVGTARNRSWMFTLGYSGEPVGFGWDYRRAGRLVIDRKFFLENYTRPQTGFYISPYARFVGMEREAEVERETYYVNGGYQYAYYPTVRERFTLFKVGVGLTFGWQYTFRGGLTLDTFVGVGVNPGYFGNLDQQQWKAVTHEYYDGRFGLLIGGLLK